MAIAEYTLATQAEPNSAAAHGRLGETYARTWVSDKAVAELSIALSLKGDNVSWLNIRAQAYQQQKKYDKAIADYDAAITLAPNDISTAPIYNNRGLSHSARDEDDAAIADYTKAIELSPKTALYTSKPMRIELLRFIIPGMIRLQWPMTRWQRNFALHPKRQRPAVSFSRPC